MGLLVQLVLPGLMATFGQLKGETSGDFSLQNMQAVEHLTPRVAECALEKSGASLKRVRVEEIIPKKHGGFVLRYLFFISILSRTHMLRYSEPNVGKDKEVLKTEGGFGSAGGYQGSCAECQDEEFDVVVVAAPQTRDKTKISGTMKRPSFNSLNTLLKRNGNLCFAQA